MEFKTVELEILEEGKMALVQFNRPDVLNTFNTQLAEDLNKAIDQIKKEGKIRAMNTPWIAAINGPCFGVGLSLACCCDFRVTSAKAKLSVAFTGVGLSPDSSLLYYLPRILGLTKATEMPTLALGLDKKMLDVRYRDTLEKHLDLEVEWVSEAAGTRDFKEGCRAFCSSVLSLLSKNGFCLKARGRDVYACLWRCTQTGSGE